MEETNAAQDPTPSNLQEPPAGPTAPLSGSLRPGSRVQLGCRHGIVEELRGTGEEPYEARIRWEGEARPVYVVYTSLEREYRLGHLKVL